MSDMCVTLSLVRAFICSIFRREIRFQVNADMMPAANPPACAAVCAAVISTEAHTNIHKPAADSSLKDTVPMRGIRMRLSGAATSVALTTARVAADAPSNKAGPESPAVRGNAR